jgi:hypothetical protein
LEVAEVVAEAVEGEVVEEAVAVGEAQAQE